MAIEPDGDHVPQERVPSGISGLDVVLRGGLLRDGLFIVQGEPGAGKTILGNQVCFNHVAAGGRALYLTLLAESHARMLMHIGPLGFFDATVIPSRLAYLSAFGALEKDGLPGLRDLIRREVQARGATLLVLDGFAAVLESSDSARTFKKFVNELQTQATLTGCTILLLTTVSSEPTPPEHTMVDGIIELTSRLYGRHAERDLQVRKLRGGSYLRGIHSFDISDRGITVYPRTEAWLTRPAATDGVGGAPVSTGLTQLDSMMGGGLPRHSTTLLVGPTGSGKTTLGLHFLAAVNQDEPALYFGLYENPAAILAKANALGLRLDGLRGSGAVELLWQSTTEGILDEVCQRLLDAVRRRGVRRLVIDGLSGFAALASEPDRLGRVFSALSNEFRTLDVATIYTAQADAVGATGGQRLNGWSPAAAPGIADSVVIMRFVELRSRLHRMISVLKVRDRASDPSMHEFSITGIGISIAPDPAGAEAILAETTQQPASGAKRSPRRSPA
ncbi:MAG TPA: ATPase domain-containing protein [Acetobacteraceae bacterium]|nr:ATPase domain-containing protein [Acetobacteraceae bacterium]